MTTPSTKALLRIAPIGAILVGLLVAALSVTPDTFRYRGWPTPPRTAPLQSLIGLSPRLGSRDPIAPAAGASRPGTGAASVGSQIAATVRTRTGGSGGFQGPAAGHAATQAPPTAPQPSRHQGRGNRSSSRRGSTGVDGNAGGKRSTPTPEPAKTVAQASSSSSSDGDRPYLHSYYARRTRDESRDGSDEQRSTPAPTSAGDCEPRAEAHAASAPPAVAPVEQAAPAAVAALEAPAPSEPPAPGPAAGD